MSELRVMLTREEIGSLCSALNEVLELVEDWEFQTRIGRTKLEIESLLNKLNSQITFESN